MIEFVLGFSCLVYTLDTHKILMKLHGLRDGEPCFGMSNEIEVN